MTSCRRRVVLTGFFLALASWGLVGCQRSDDSGCRVDSDCAGDLRCLDGSCRQAFGGGAGGGSGDAGTDGGGGSGGSAGGLGGERCDDAPLITLPTTLQASTTSSRNDISTACTAFDPSIHNGPDQVYRAVMPPGQRLRASVTPELAQPGQRQYDPAIYLLASPPATCTAVHPDGGSAAVCLAADDTGPVTAVNAVSFTNVSAVATEVFVVVDSVIASSSTTFSDRGGYQLAVRLDTPPLGDLCSAPEPLTSGTVKRAQTLDDFGNDCTWGSNCKCSGGADRVYQVEVPPGERLWVTVTPSSALDPTISLVGGASACGLACLSAVDNGWPGEPETLGWTNSGTHSTTALIVVDSFPGDTGFFDILATVGPAPAGDRCQTATPLSGALLGQTTAGFSNDYQNDPDTSGCSPGTFGGDRVYLLTVPTGLRAEVTVTPTSDGGFDPSLNFVDSPASTCDAKPRVCLSGANTAGPNQVEVASYFNASGAPRDVFAIVDSALGEEGTFEVSVSLSRPLPGDVCQNAERLAGTLRNQTTAGYSNDYRTGSGTTTCGPSIGTTGNDRVYLVEVPPGQRNRVRVMPTASFDPSLTLVETPASTCSAQPRVCVVGADLAGPGAEETTAFFNVGDAGLELFVVVDSSASQVGTFDIASETAVPAPDDTCSTSVTALDGGVLSAQSLAGFELDYPRGTDCVGGAVADRVYRVTVPGRHRLQNSVVPLNRTDAGFDPVLSYLWGPASRCESAARVCAASTNSGYPGEPETLAWANPSDAGADLFVVVSSARPRAPDLAFDLVSRLEPAQRGEWCFNPIGLDAGTMTRHSVDGFTRDYHLTDAGCANSRGAEVVYRVEISAGGTLSLTLTPTRADGGPGGPGDPVLNLLPASESSCSASLCLASADRAATGGIERLSWPSDGGVSAPTSVFVVVSNYWASPMQYDLEVQVR